MKLMEPGFLSGGPCAGNAPFVQLTAEPSGAAMSASFTATEKSGLR
jgi:hypothetical protein